MTNPPLTKQARSRLIKVKETILKYPQAFDLSDWGSSTDEIPFGTVACIAGWVVALEYGPLAPYGSDTWQIEDHNVEREALDLLDLKVHTNHPLFCLWSWPDEILGRFGWHYNDAPYAPLREKIHRPDGTAVLSSDITAEQAAIAIDWFLEHSPRA